MLYEVITLGDEGGFLRHREIRSAGADDGHPPHGSRQGGNVERGINPFDHGSALHTDMWKTEGLKQAISYNFV